MDLSAGLVGMSVHDRAAESSQVLVGGAYVAEQALPFGDACIGDFVAGGLHTAAAGRAFRACWHYTVGEMLDTHPLGPLRHPTQRELVMAAVDPEALPMMAAVRDEPRARAADDYAQIVDALIASLLGK